MPALPSGEGRQRRLLMGWEVIVMLGECAGPDGISRDGRSFRADILEEVGGQKLSAA